MRPEDSDPVPDHNTLLESLKRLEARMSRLEAQVGLPDGAAPAGVSAAAGADTPAANRDALEARLGEFGLAWAGSLVLLLGIVFLMAYVRGLGWEAAATAAGYAAVGALWLIFRLLRESNPQFSLGMLIIGILLLYYTTAQLHFFSTAPLVPNLFAAIALLLAVLALMTRLALARNSQSLACLSFALAATTALLADSPQVSLPLLAVFAGAAAWVALHRGWFAFLNAAIPMAYLAQLIWLIGNPAAGQAIHLSPERQSGLVLLFILFAVFYAATLFAHQRRPDDEIRIAGIALNSTGFLIVTTISVFAFFQNEFAAVYLALGAAFLLASVLEWVRTHENWIPSAYAGFGHLGITVAIYGYTGAPHAFFWLTLQSLLVVCMALWFRSKVLVVLNFLIFISILIAYLATSPMSSLVNFAFAGVALASARIMNWQQQRLTLRTEMLRNLYLALVFGMMLNALQHAVPRNYVALSWTGAAVAYFGLSLLLRNIKYRWMSVLTLLATVMHVFFSDLRRLEGGHRVAALLFLGAITLIISFVYTRLRSGVAKGKPGEHSDDSTRHFPTQA